MTEFEFLGVFFAIALFWVIVVLVVAFFMNGTK
jgi:hypothetical protein